MVELVEAHAGRLSRARLEALLRENPEIELVISRRGIVTAAALDALGLDEGSPVCVTELVEMLFALQCWSDVFRACDHGKTGFVSIRLTLLQLTVP